VNSMYRTLVRVIAVVLILMGLSMLSITLSHGFGVGVVLGLLFIAAGAGRLYLLRKTG